MVSPLSPTGHADTFTRDHLPPLEQWPELVGLEGLNYADRMNCAEELLDRTIAEHGGERRCLLGVGEEWTYGQLRRGVNQLAHTLVAELGVRPGSRVLLRGPNSPWMAACWLAILKTGGVVVTVLPALRSGELSTILQAAAVEYAVCDHRHLDELVTAREQVRAAGGPDLDIRAYGGTDPQDLIRSATQQPADFAAVRVAADDACMIAYTSGTTGQPKGCVHFHRDVLAIADTFSTQVLRPLPEDLFVGSPPLAFTFGLGGLLVFPLRAGAATLLLERAGPDELLEAIESYGASVMFTAPTAYRAMLGKLTDTDMSSLRRCVSAGEHLPEATWHDWEKATGIRIIDGIGATEMLHIFIAAADDDIRPGSTGRAVSGFETAILDEEGNAVPDGQPGRLAVRGPTGCRYLADARQRRYVQQGWNLTGDTYIRDAEGYLWFQSRSDDMIITSGYNVAPAEVEEALASSPDVLESAVVGVSCPERGMLVKAWVVLAAGLSGTEVSTPEERAEALKAHVKARLAPYKTPRAVEFLSALPRTTTGKLQRYKLREPA